MQANVEYENNYGMGVPEAWSMGYSGRGVTIAITDVGVNTDLEDLKHNIVRPFLCLNMSATGKWFSKLLFHDVVILLNMGVIFCPRLLFYLLLLPLGWFHLAILLYVEHTICGSQHKCMLVLNLRCTSYANIFVLMCIWKQ